MSDYIGPLVNAKAPQQDTVEQYIASLEGKLEKAELVLVDKEALYQGAVSDWHNACDMLHEAEAEVKRLRGLVLKGTLGDWEAEETRILMEMKANETPVG